MLSFLAFAALAVGVPAQERPHELWSTGRANPYAYHQVVTTCVQIRHGYGRNAAWGAWVLPLDQVSVGLITPSPQGGFKLAFDCVDGSACIAKGAYTRTPDRVAEHEIPFETIQGAQDYLDWLTAHRTRCATAAD